jgi:hypothetical protein
MAQIAGFTVERTASGKPTFAHIDLCKHSRLIPVLESNGFEIEQPIKWTKKMKRSFEQAKRGEIYEVDMNNFWDE